MFVITPGKIKVYNCNALPPVQSNEALDDQKRLLFPKPGPDISSALENLIAAEDARQSIEAMLGVFNRESIDTGKIWEDNYIARTVNTNTRVDQRLLQNLRAIRQKLQGMGISSTITHRLLIRSFFVMYLQDRQALPDDCLPSIPEGDAKNYLDILRYPKATYKLFRNLNRRFNDRLFPIDTQENNSINGEHLELLREFLMGIDLETGQLPLIRLYDFGHIPIEMISSLYQEFLTNLVSTKATGAFYTPPLLVNLILDEVMPWHNQGFQKRVLDPACGSGVFLVEAYHRLVERWRRGHVGDRVNADILRHIMINSLYGVDLDPDAIKVTAFSLYLAMLDYLEPDYIRRRMRRFPALENNLVQSDFFDVSKLFIQKDFDLIVGNVPWASRLTPMAEQYCKENNYPISDKQIAQAFLWRAGDFSRSKGEICLLVSSKAILFNQQSHIFREKFFTLFNVQMIINFSSLRHDRGVMFSTVIGPAAAIFYKTGKPDRKGIVTYIVPKPSSRSRHLGIPVLDATEIKHLLLDDLLKQSSIWKTAMWGTARDQDLIQHLQRLPRLKDFLEKNPRGKPQEGYQVSSKRAKQRNPKLKGRDSIPSGAKVRYIITDDHIEPLKIDTFYSIKDIQIYEPPMVIVHQSPIQGEVYAVFSSKPVIYPETYAGIPGYAQDIPYLKLLTLLLNSSLASYYYFMTAAKWGVERDDIQLNEHLALPFIAPDLQQLKDPESLFAQLLKAFEAVSDLKSSNNLFQNNAETRLRTKIDDLLFALYGLTDSERDLVLDTVNVTIPFFLQPSSSKASHQPDLRTLEEYAEVYEETFRITGKYSEFSLSGLVYPPAQGIPLNIVVFEIISPSRHRTAKIVDPDNRTDDLIYALDKKLMRQDKMLSQSLFVRRHARVYDEHHIYIVKPAENRFWTRSMARNDADEMVAELISEYKRRRDGEGKI